MERILEVTQSLDLYYVDSTFRKAEKHLITYSSGGRQSQIDYILTRKGEQKQVKDCKVINGEAIATQHRLLVMDINWVVKKKRTVSKPSSRC